MKSTNGQDFSYKFGNKNNWRRWAWNRVCERIPDKNTAIVLYLAGHEYLDVDVAIGKGFRRENMIAIEQDDDSCRQLRKSGVLTIHGEFCDVLEDWPLGRKVDVIVGDFCCGLEWELIRRLSSILERNCFVHATVVLNFLRGRDSSSNWMRTIMYRRYFDSEAKSRSYQALLLFALEWSSARSACERQQMRNWFVDCFFGEEHSQLTAALRSYKSKSKQLFDSVVFRNPLGVLLDTVRKTIEPGEWRLVEENMLREQKGTKRPQANQISAILAHRTMRLNQTNCARK